MRLDEGLERAFNPIMLKELRGSLRGLRFFIAYLVILSLFALGLLTAFYFIIPGWNAGFDETDDPAAVGRKVFLLAQMIQLGIALLVVPGLAATSISGEHEGKTLELLLTTTMSAGRVVWGKFCAAMTQAFMIFFSLLPLVALCFLFGGITVYQIALTYGILFALSALMAAFALSMSAAARSTSRAVGSVYALTALGMLALAAVGALMEDGRYLQELASEFGYADASRLQRLYPPMGALERLAYLLGLPAAFWTALIALFFINATNRLKPIYANRSTPVRIYALSLLFGGGALLAIVFYSALPAGSGSDARSFALMGLAIATLTFSILGSLFACEDPPSERIAAQAASFRGLRRPLRLLWPGSESGAAFTVIATLIFAAAATEVFVPFCQDFDRGQWATSPPTAPLATAFAMVVCWSWFTTGLARGLTAALPGRGLLVRVLLILACLFLTLFPLVHWAVANAIDRDPSDLRHERGPITLALSPVMAVSSSLDLRPGRRDFPWRSGPLPIVVAFPALMLAGGLAGRLWARRKSRQTV